MSMTNRQAALEAAARVWAGRGGYVRDRDVVASARLYLEFLETDPTPQDAPRNGVRNTWMTPSGLVWCHWDGTHAGTSEALRGLPGNTCPVCNRNVLP